MDIETEAEGAVLIVDMPEGLSERVALERWCWSLVKACQERGIMVLLPTVQWLPNLRHPSKDVVQWRAVMRVARWA